MIEQNTDLQIYKFYFIKLSEKKTDLFSQEKILLVWK